MYFPIKKYLSVSVSLAQILSTSLVNLSAADLRPRNHIQPLGNDALAPQMSNSANGRDVVNIINPNAEGISHNKYESFDITKDNGVILNNSQENGVSITGGYVTANPNLSSNAKLIINEIFSNKNTSLNGTLEVFGKGADVMIANENGIIVNGASFINTTGVTLTTGLIDTLNKEISVRQGNIGIFNGGVGIDGNYFSIISESMQLLGNISKLDGSALERINFIAGLNNVKLANGMRNPIFEKNAYKSAKKPKFAIDGNMLGSMYAGYVQFVSTQDGVGVRHLGVVRSASDIVINSRGDITIGASIAQNIDVKTTANLNNEGVIIADKDLKIEAQTLNNANAINTEIAQKLNLSLKTSYLQAQDVKAKFANIYNQGNIVGTKSLYMGTLNTLGEFQNNGGIASNDLRIETSSFANNGAISSSLFELTASEKSLNTGNINANTLNLKTKDFNNQNTIISNVATLNTSGFTNSGSIQSGMLKLDTQSLTNSSKISTYNTEISATNIKNSGSIESENQLSVIFKDTSKSSSEVLQNENGIFQSNNILNLKGGSIDIDSNFGKFSANKMLLIQSDGDILIKKTLSNLGSIGLKAKENISNDSNTLLASQNDLYLYATAVLNNTGGYLFGNNITIESNKIQNDEDATIDAQAVVTLKADVIDNNTGVIHSGKDMNIFAQTINNIGKTTGEVSKIKSPSGFVSFWNNDDYYHYLWDQRTFQLRYTSFTLSNALENKQAIIKSDSNLNISSKDEKKADIYNNNSVIGAKNDINIAGNVYNTTKQTTLSAWQLLNDIEIKDGYAITAGNAYWNIGASNLTELVRAAWQSPNYYDREGYWKLLLLIGQKDKTFNQLMSAVYGSDWMASNPEKVNKNPNTFAQLSFTPKQPAQIVAGNNINIAGDTVYNSTGSIQKINADISSIEANLKNIQNFTSSQAQKISEQNLPNNEDSKELKTNKETSSKEILKSVGLSEEEILGLGSKLLFHVSGDNLNSKVNYYIETRDDLVDMNKFFGSQYFFNQIGYAPSKPISVIGDSYYENRLLNYQLTQNLGYSNALSSDDIKDFLDNAVLEQKNLGLVVGEPLSEEQISKLDKDIVWYVNKKINGVNTLVPQLYYSKNTSLKKTAVTEGSTIASSGDLFLNTGMVQNQSSTLQADGVLGVNAYDEVKNIGGVILGELVGINAKSLLSQSQMGINNSGDFNIINEAKIASKSDIVIRAQGDVKIQNSEIISEGKGSTINVVSKQGLITILDDTAKKTTYAQGSKEDSDSSWVSTTIASTSLSSGSKIQGDNINFKAGDNITIQGSSLAQTSKEGSINLIADGDVKILAGSKDSQIQTHTFFSGVNQKSGMREYGTTTNTNETQHQAMGSSIEALGNINIHTKKDLTIKSSGLISDKMINLSADGKVSVLDSQNTSNVTSSYTSYQVLGIKGGSQTQNASLSSGSLLKGGEGIFINSKGSTHIVGSDLDGGNNDVVFASKENLKIEAGKNTIHQEDTSYGFGIVGSANVGIIGNQASVGFGINEGNFALTQSNFDSKTLSSGKIQMSSLASADLGLEFSYNSQTTDSVHYANSNIKSGGNIGGFVSGVADIGGANLTSGNDVILQAGSIETSKYVDTNTTHSIGFNLSIKQKGQITSSAVDTINMIADVATKAADGKNLNAGVVAASAAGAVTNLVFNDLIGTVSTQEASFQVDYQDSHKTSENITKVSAKGNISIQSSSGDIDLKGVAFKGDSLNLDSVKNINITAAKSTNEENGFSFGAQARLQESAGYSALWGSNTDIGVGGNANVTYSQKNQTSYETSSFEIKNQADISSKDDLNIIGGRINADSADVKVGGNLHIASVVDSNDSKNFNANLGGDVSLGIASNTIGKGNLALNGGGGYYYEDSKTVATQSGILTQNTLDINVKADANLQGAVLSSKSKTGTFEVGKQLSISDLNLHQNNGGGGVNLSGGLSGNFGGHINVGDSKNEESLLHSAINVAVKTDEKIIINGVQASLKDIYTDTNKTKTTLSNSSFSGGDISFSGNVGQIKEIFSSLKKPSHLSESSLRDNDRPTLLDSAQSDGTPSQDDGFKETLVLQYSESTEQPNFAPSTPKHFPSMNTSEDSTSQSQENSSLNLASLSNPQSSHQTSQNSASGGETLSLAQKIKNFFVRNKGSYDAQDLALKSEESDLLAYGKINDNLPPKSDFVLSEQGLIASQNKHQKDLEKFGTMREEVPPRAPIKQKRQKSESDKKDFEDFIDRGILEVQDLNVSQSADLLSSVVKNPIFIQNSTDENLRHYFVELLSEVGEHFPYSREAKEYKNLTNKIYTDLDNRLKGDPQVADYIRNFDPSNEGHYKKLTKRVVEHYTDALRNTDLKVADTGMYFSKKFENAYYWAVNDAIHIPIKEAYKNAYFGNENPTPEEFALNLFDSVVHEMTHKQQDTFVRNMDNPAIPQSIKDYAFIMNLNRIYYANAKHGGYNLYRGQILEIEAFNHGEDSAKKFKNFLESNPQPKIPQPEPSEPQRNPFVQRVLNLFSKQTTPNDAQSMVPNPNIGAIPTPETSHQTSQNSASGEENLSLAQKIKSFFVRNKGSYDVKDLTSKLEKDGILTYNLPPKSDFVLSEQGLIASQNKHQKDLEKFGAMGEQVPPRAPIKQKRQKSESDKKDLEDSIDRGIFEIQDLNLSQSTDLLGAIVKNPVFMTNSKDQDLRSNFVHLLSEVGDNFPYSREAREYKDLTKKIYTDLDNRLKNDPQIAHYIRNFDPSNEGDYKKLTKRVVEHYSETLKNTDLEVTPTKMYFSKKFQDAYYLPTNDSINIPVKEAYKKSYFKNQNPTSEEFGLHLLNTVVHEMTHKQQQTFVKNMHNPAIPQNIKDYSFIINLNGRYYANAHRDGYNLYRGQILENEAFNHGEDSAKKFKNFLESNPQPTVVEPEPSGSQRNPFVQRVLNLFSKQTPSSDAQSTVPNSNEGAVQIQYSPAENKNLQSNL